MDAVLGIDVGGTSIKVGLFTPEGELLEERKVPTPALVNEDAYAVVTSGITRVLAAHDAAPADVIACGLDIPGPVADDGRLSEAGATGNRRTSRFCARHRSAVRHGTPAMRSG